MISSELGYHYVRDNDEKRVSFVSTIYIPLLECVRASWRFREFRLLRCDGNCLK